MEANIMPTLALDHDTEQGLATLAALTGRSTQDLLRDAVLRYVEDIEDAREAEAVYQRIQSGDEKVISLEEHLADGAQH